MWKETEYYPKRDDDSAIGDSANNSAGEESTNSRRKSSTSDDIDEMHSLTRTHLTAKLGTKVPECLLKDSDEILENCKRLHQNSINNATKSKRVIRVLPASAVLKKKSPEQNKPVVKEQPNTAALEAKLQYLFFEMRKLRELDRDIFRKFSEINESVEEMRWKIAENEANLKRDMTEDGVTGDEVTGLSDSRISEWEDLDFMQKLDDDEEDLKFVVPITKASTSYASLTYVKSSKNNALNSSTKHARMSSQTILQHQKPSESNAASTKEKYSRSYSNPSYVKVDSKDRIAEANKKPQGSPVATIEIEKLDKNNYYRFKSPHPSPAASVSSSWRDDSSIQSRSPASSRIVTRSQSTRSASQIARKYSDRVQKNQQLVRSSRSSSSFRMVTDENSIIGRRSHWPIFEEEQKTSDFQKHQEYRNLLGLSRVRGHLSKSMSVTNSRDSTESRRSSASLTSSASSSSSSIASPTRSAPARSNSSKWSRLGLGAKSSKSQSSNSTVKNDTVIMNNNYKDDIVAKQRSAKLKPRDHNVVPASYKRSQSNNVYNWIQSQDDVTFL